MTTCAPSSTKRSTIPRPSPLAPPVTIATLPSRSPTICPPLDARSRNLFDPEIGRGVDLVRLEDGVDLGKVGVVDRPADRARVVLDLGDVAAADERSAHCRVRERPAQGELRQALVVPRRDAFE